MARVDCNGTGRSPVVRRPDGMLCPVCCCVIDSHDIYMPDHLREDPGTMTAEDFDG